MLEAVSFPRSQRSLSRKFHNHEHRIGCNQTTLSHGNKTPPVIGKPWLKRKYLMSDIKRQLWHEDPIWTNLGQIHVNTYRHTFTLTQLRHIHGGCSLRHYIPGVDAGLPSWSVQGNQYRSQMSPVSAYWRQACKSNSSNERAIVPRDVDKLIRLILCHELSFCSVNTIINAF